MQGVAEMIRDYREWTTRVDDTPEQYALYRELAEAVWEGDLDAVFTAATKLTNEMFGADDMELI